MYKLLIGDDLGEVTVLDIRGLIHRLGVEPLQPVRATQLLRVAAAAPCSLHTHACAAVPAQNKQPPNLPSYSAHRRFARTAVDHDSSAPSGLTSALSSRSGRRSTCLLRLGCVRALSVVSHGSPPPSL